MDNNGSRGCCGCLGCFGVLILLIMLIGGCNAIFVTPKDDTHNEDKITSEKELKKKY